MISLICAFRCSSIRLRMSARNFMDALADSGAMSAEAAERIKNAGQWTITVRDEYGNVAGTPGAPGA